MATATVLLHCSTAPCRHSRTASFPSGFIPFISSKHSTKHTSNINININNNHSFHSSSLASLPPTTNTSMAAKQAPYPQERSHHKRFSQRYSSSSSSYTEYSSALAASYQHLQQQYYQQQQQQQQQQQLQLQYQAQPQAQRDHRQHTRSSSIESKDDLHLQEPFGIHSKKQSPSRLRRNSPPSPCLSSLDSSCCFSHSHSALPSPSLSVSSTDSVSSASMAHCSPILPNISLLDPLDSMASSREQLQDVHPFIILFTVVFTITITITPYVKGNKDQENIIYGVQFQPWKPSEPDYSQQRLSLSLLLGETEEAFGSSITVGALIVLSTTASNGAGRFFFAFDPVTHLAPGHCPKLFALYPFFAAASDSPAAACPWRPGVLEF
ncbi:MAG: hypothetical protein BYD32DRAFT_454991 [Podila humilis]|nr:MAG: hypothetical protein BYD32DRAFT_454991 [Podila humilis]